MHKEKETIRVTAHCHPNTGLEIEEALEGYEIHLGRTILMESAHPFLVTEAGREEGYFGEGGRIIGTYFHHLFHNDAWRNQWLNHIRRRKGIPEREINKINDYKDRSFDELAVKLKDHLNWNLVKAILGQWGSQI